MKANELSITFKLSKKLKNSELCTIRCNIRVNRSSVEFHTEIRTLEVDWVSSKPTYMIKKNAEATKKINMLIDELQKIGAFLGHKGYKYKANEVLERYRNGDCRAIDDSFKFAKNMFLEKYQSLYLSDAGSLGMVKKYKTLMSHLSSFLQFSGFNIDTCSLRDITKKYIPQLEHYCRTCLKLSHNVTKNTLMRTSFFMKFCVANELLERNIFTGYTFAKSEHKEPIFLSEDKVKRLKFFAFTSENLSKTRDIFLFQCYTGLAYADLVLLKEGKHKVLEIKEDKNFKFWIKGNRQKSSTYFNVPILPQAMEIINKYNGVANFPILTNQKYNFNLKQIQNILGFDEYLTTHVARKTCGFFPMLLT